MIKPWLDVRTQQKIKLCTYGADDQVWPIVDPEVLPEVIHKHRSLAITGEASHDR